MVKKVNLKSQNGPYWNYRIGTRMSERERLYTIVEVYYNEDNEPKGYCKEHSNPLGQWEDVDSMAGTHKLIKHAFSKPIIDLDRFPELYHEKIATKSKKKEKKSR